MPLVDNAWYVNYGNGTNTGYYAVAQWVALTVYAAGALVRQLAAPAVGSERVFVCVVAGTTLAAEPTWTLTRGALTAEAAGPTWQECTGIAALNGDATNTPSWTITATPPGGVKNIAVVLGQVIKRDSGASYQICTTAGTAGNGAEPAFSNTAGTTTADNTVTWTSLGVVGNFTGWQAPLARLVRAFTATWGQAGNSFFVASEHAETQAAAMTLTSPGTAANPCFIYCVTKTALPPVSANLSTGATISTTGANAMNNLRGYNTYYGISFISGANIGSPSAAAGGFVYLDNCKLACASGSSIFAGQNLQYSQTIWNNTTVKFGGTGSTITFQTISRGFVWQNTASAIDAAGSTPTTLFTAATNPQGSALLRGVDLSLLGAGSTIVNLAAIQQIDFTMVDCKLGASVTIAATPVDPAGWTLNLIRCDSGATNYRDERYWYEGTQIVDTTIVRTGGATDGTTLISWKLATTANSKWVMPFESQPITIWNDSTSAITTLTFYGTTTGGGVPKDDEIWVEVEYLGSSATPLGSFITTTKANNLAASVATNNSSDGSTWAGGGAGNGFKIVVPSFTPGMKGPFNITIKVAKVSATYYIDPKPEISGVTVSRSEILAPGVYMNETAAAASGGGIRLAGRGGLAMGA